MLLTPARTCLSVLAVAGLLCASTQPAAADDAPGAVVREVQPDTPPSPPYFGDDDGGGGEDDEGGGIRFINSVAALDGTRVVLHGGFGGDDLVLGDTWVHDGTSWTPVCGTTEPGADEACPPGPRGFHVLIDGGPGLVVLYGGAGSADTWTFDGTTWTPVCGTAVPGADGECGPGVLFAPGGARVGGETYLVGGVGESDPDSGTTVWRFTGTGWELVPSAGPVVPASRVGAGVSPYGAGFLLHSGGRPGPDEEDDGPPPPLGDTWSFDLASRTWTPICGTDQPGADAPCGPAATLIAQMVEFATPQGSRVLMAGGLLVPEDDDDVAFSGAVWLFVDGAWQQQPGWDDLSPGDGDLDVGPNPPPLGLALALRPATCDAIGPAVAFGDDPGASPPEVVTVRFGWDRTGDGLADGCWVAPGSSDPGSAPPSDPTGGGPAQPGATDPAPQQAGSGAAPAGAPAARPRFAG